MDGTFCCKMKCEQFLRKNESATSLNLNEFYRNYLALRTQLQRVQCRTKWLAQAFCGPLEIGSNFVPIVYHELASLIQTKGRQFRAPFKQQTRRNRFLQIMNLTRSNRVQYATLRRQQCRRLARGLCYYDNWLV